MQIDDIAGLEQKVAAIENEIKSILSPDDRNGNSSNYEILNSVKGVGIVTMATFLVFAGDVQGLRMLTSSSPMSDSTQRYLNQ